MKIAVALIILAFLLGLASYLSNLESVQIIEVTFHSNSISETESLEKVVHGLLEGKYFGLYSKRNVLIYPKNEIKSEILKEFPRVEKVSLKLLNLEELKITIKEREPDATWCGPTTESVSETENQCYFVDQEGFIYSKAPTFSGNLFFRLFGKTDRPGSVGRYYLSSSRYQTLKSFRNVLKQMGLSPIELHKLEDGDMEVYFSDNSKIIFNIEDDFSVLTRDLESILTDKTFSELRESDENELEYIDLRFGNKAYYKFR